MSKSYKVPVDEAIGSLTQFMTAFCQLSTAWMLALENGRRDPNDDDIDIAHRMLTRLAEALAEEGENVAGYAMIKGMLEAAKRDPVRPRLRLVRDDDSEPPK